jgi:hypothetical protein
LQLNDSCNSTCCPLRDHSFLHNANCGI